MLAIGYADPLPVLKSPLQSPLLSDHPLQPDPSGPRGPAGTVVDTLWPASVLPGNRAVAMPSAPDHLYLGIRLVELPPGTQILFSPTIFLTHGKLQIAPCVPVSGRREMNLKKNNQ